MVKVAFEPVNSEDGHPVERTKLVKKSHWFLKSCVLLIVALAAAPSLVSLTNSLPTVMKKLHPKLADAVSFGNVKIHWWAPIEVENVKVLDLSHPRAGSEPGSEPAVLCELERIATVEPLWRIVLNAGRGTGLVAKSPRLNLIADDQGTNVERTLKEVFGESNDPTEGRFPFRITVENGFVRFSSQSVPGVLDPTLTSGAADSTPSNSFDLNGAGPKLPVNAEITDINGTFSTMDTSRWLPALKLSASIRQSSAQNVAIRTTARPVRIAASLAELTNDFPDIPLEDLVGKDASGDANAARIQIYLQPDSDNKGRQTIQVGARDVDLQLVQPLLSMLGIDAHCTGMISGGIDARLAGPELKDGLVGKIILAGDDVRIRQSTWAVDEWLPLGTVNANGAIAIAEDGLLVQDLNILTSVAELSGTGELRHQRIESGATAPPSQKVELNGTIQLAQLASSLRKTLSLHDDVTIKSGKLVFQAIGSATAAEVANSGLESAAGASQTGSWTLVAKADALQAERAGKPLKVDSKMQLDAVGPFAHGVPELLRARFTAGFGTIDCVPEGSAWKVSGLVQPSSLWETLKQFADVTQPGIRGDVSFKSTVMLLDDGIQLIDLQLNSSDVRASSNKLSILPLNPLTSMLEGNIHVEGHGAALRALLLPWTDAAFLADQAQVVANLTASPKREIQLDIRITPAGIAAVPPGKLTTVSQSQSRMTTASASIFAVDEADVNLSMITSSDGSKFDISRGTVKLPGLSSQISGTVSVPDGHTLLNLTADTSYDLEILSQRIFASDSGIALRGQGRDVFKLKGDPASISGTVQKTKSDAAGERTLEGSGAVQWASANLWGLSLGGASVPTELENNLLRAGPVQCSLNGGQLSAMGQYDLVSSQMQLGAGSRVENISVTPQLCREWLGYVAPLLADATEVNGQLSLRVERFLWDFNAQQNSDVSGQLTIHRASAAPGASVASLLQVVDLLRQRDGTDGLSSTSLTLPEQTVAVQVRQGYVIHDGLTVDLAGYRVKSTGAVGLNEQLQITLDVPMEKGTTSNVRSIKVPLRGTIKSPQPDTSALIKNLGLQKIQEQLGADKIQEKLGDEVDDTINKSLNKLLKRF